MRYVVVKHPRRNGYAIRDTERSANETMGHYERKKDASEQCAKKNYALESKAAANHLAEWEVVKLGDVPIGRRVQFVERASEHPPGKPYRTFAEYMTVVGNQVNNQVPCEDGFGKQRPIHESQFCRVMPLPILPEGDKR